MIRSATAYSDRKPILYLTTYHVGADDDKLCAGYSNIRENLDKCSFDEDSIHTGEVKWLLENAKDKFDYFNLMAYDAGQNFRYQTALNNYYKIIGDKTKINLGLSIATQWDDIVDHDVFVQSIDNNKFRTEWAKQNGFGGIFVWANGSVPLLEDKKLSFSEQVNRTNELFDIIDGSKEFSLNRILPNKISYLTDWGLTNEDGSNVFLEHYKNSKTNATILAFAKWSAAGNIVRNSPTSTLSSEDILDGGINEWWQPAAYESWTHHKYDNQNHRVLIAFGGQNDADIWEYLLTNGETNSSTIMKLALNLIDLYNENFPVYKKEDDGELSIIGYVNIDGFDFDFEKPERITLAEQQAMLQLGQTLKELTHSFDRKPIISLTTYHVGADNVDDCDGEYNNLKPDKCSYDKASDHTGEVRWLLENGKNDFDLFNLMAYDAGENFRYQTALNNYNNLIEDKTKVRLGLSIASQWAGTDEQGNSISFVQTQSENINRASWQNDNGYGGVFVWANGSVPLTNGEYLSYSEQINQTNILIENINNKNINGFTVNQYQHLSGYNNKHYKNISREACGEQCLNDDNCLSFDYFNNTNECDISYESKLTKPSSFKTNTGGYDYYHRDELALSSSSLDQFTVNDKQNLKGFNNKNLKSVTKLDCANECLNDTQCLSFDYHNNTNECDISYENKDTKPKSFEKNKGSFDYFHKKDGTNLEKFSRMADYGLSGYNNRHLNNITRSECADKCLEDTQCLSFDYYNNTNECDISYESMLTKPLDIKRNLGKYDYYHKK